MNDVRPVPELVDRLFREEAGRMIAGLTRVFGPARLELVEDVVQEALVRALRTWPLDGVPPNPRAWLVHVARNRALDLLRADRVADRSAAEVARWADEAVSVDDADDAIGDDQLRLMILCCHPSIGFDSRVALTLKTVCGLGVGEIARAFLVDETAIAQRLVRAKRRIQEEGFALELPCENELVARVDALLEVVYLLFTEGYSARAGDELVRAELVYDATRLITLMASSVVTSSPPVHAVAAIVHFQGARLAARIGDDGEALTLAEQDRSRWDRDRLARGWRHFEQSIAGDELSAYHLEAAIAAAHASAPTYAATDWRTILAHYDRLIALQPSPIRALNRAVVLAKVEGTLAGLRALATLEHEPALAHYPLFAATRGLLAWSAGDALGATTHFEAALALSCNAAERRLFEKRILAVRAGESAIPF
ncbi:MAG: sigma-70 family RNA polymerase sigma factor [Planctomycetota bacterium]|nr:sigma-70 family RNA polymerase sigma factor [Planctomycetota bacterium]